MTATHADTNMNPFTALCGKGTVKIIQKIIKKSFRNPAHVGQGGKLKEDGMTKNEEQIKITEAMGYKRIPTHNHPLLPSHQWICPDGKQLDYCEVPNPHESWDDCWAAVDEICPEEIYFLSIVRNRKTPTTKYTVHLTIKFLSFMGFGETPKAAIVAALLKYLEEPK